MKTRIASLALLACLFAALPAASAEADVSSKMDTAIQEALQLPQCHEETGTIPGCYNLIIQMGLEHLAEERVQDKVTSAETAIAGASPLRDALSRFIAAAGIPGLSNDDGKISFGYNFPSGFLDDEVQLSFKATAEEPTVYQPLLEAFEEEARAAKKSSLEEQLGDFDDIDFELAGSRLSQRWGRDFDSHRRLFQSLWTQTASLRTISIPSQTGFLDLINRLDCSDLNPFEATFAQLEAGCKFLSGTTPRAAPLSEALVSQSLHAALVSNARATVKNSIELVDIATTKGLMEVADLVNNQPQLFLSASYRDRDGGLAGPDQLSAHVKWEVGFHNVNGLRRFCQAPGQLQPAANGQSQPTLDCVHNFVYCSENDSTDCSPQINKARKARRASLSAEYTEIDRYQFSPEEGIDLLRDRSESVKAMLAYGWQLTTEADGTGGTRIDLESVYENVSGDPMKNDRWVGSVTYSQQISGEAAASISLLWANKPEYLGEVDEELSARAGLKWTMDPGDE